MAKKKDEPTPDATADGQGIATIRMVRDEAPDGGPTEADVHPEEIENYKAGGWRIAE